MIVSVADIFGHIATTIYLVGSLLKGALTLRLSWVLGTIGELVYDLYVAPEPLWTNIGWCLAISVLNTHHIVLILKNQRRSGLNPQKQELYQRLFTHMDWGNFRKMMKTARWEVLTEDRVVIRKNQPVDSLFMLAGGAAGVSLSGKRVARMQSGSFIGEMSLLTGQLPTATVRVERGLCWLAGPRPPSANYSRPMKASTTNSTRPSAVTSSRNSNTRTSSSRADTTRQLARLHPILP